MPNIDGFHGTHVPITTLPLFFSNFVVIDEIMLNSFLRRAKEENMKKGS